MVNNSKELLKSTLCKEADGKADSPAWDVLSQFVPGGGAVVGGVRGSNKDKTGIGMLQGAGGQFLGQVGGGLGGVGLSLAGARINPRLALSMLPLLGALSGGAFGQNLATRKYNKPEPSLLDKIRKITQDTGENISKYFD